MASVFSKFSKVFCTSILIFILPNFAMASGAGQHQVINNIAICMVAAGIAGLLMRALSLPLILGFLIAGAAIGPIGLRLLTDHAEISTVAEIGLIFLLFMIGLEIDLRKMLAAGRMVLVPGLLGVPLTVLLGVGFFKWVGLTQLIPHMGPFANLYMAIAISFGSTMIAVKLLYDKFELDTLSGRITVGILIFQDIWAIIVLALQPNLENPELKGIAWTFAAGAVVIAGAFLLAKYVLPHVFRAVAKIPELVLILALGWCFLISLISASKEVGLSMEMGALIAGVSLATFPYNLDVIAKVISLRDFFLTLFFVALGMQIPMPTAHVVLYALALTVVVLALRFIGIFGLLYPIRSGHRTSLLATINLSQVSEFSLVILSIGITYGHISQTLLTYVLWIFSLMAVGSTYLIKYNQKLQAWLSKLLTMIGLKDLSSQKLESIEEKNFPIVMLGFFRIASGFVDEVSQHHQDLCEKILVVDFNPVVKQKLEKMNIACLYGDVSHPDTLHHAEIHKAKIVLCTIPDTFLKGTSNLKLLKVLKNLCPHAQIIVTAESHAQSEILYRQGADYVIQVADIVGTSLVNTVMEALNDNLEEQRDISTAKINLSQEILS